MVKNKKLLKFSSKFRLWIMTFSSKNSKGILQNDLGDPVEYHMVKNKKLLKFSSRWGLWIMTFSNNNFKGIQQNDLGDPVE
jgi:uncharacterized protein YbgA (DUF1722 family)